MAGMGSMAGWLATKYGILQQQADTATAAQRAQAPVDAARANALNMLTPAQVAQTRAQTGVADAQARGMNITNAFLPDTLRSDIDFRRTQARATDVGSFYDTLNRANSSEGTGLGDAVDSVRSRYRSIGGLKKGTARVPGKGDGTKDTVPAKLAPGEAVLNKAAAEHVGRGLIAHLNSMGAEKMGLVPPPQKGKTQNFAAGTEEVQPLDDVRGSLYDSSRKPFNYVGDRQSQADAVDETTRLVNKLADQLAGRDPLTVSADRTGKVRADKSRSR